MKNPRDQLLDEMLVMRCQDGNARAMQGKTRWMAILVWFESLLFTGLAKVWYWMLMNRNCVQRDIKRLELRILELTRDKQQ